MPGLNKTSSVSFASILDSSNDAFVSRYGGEEFIIISTIDVDANRTINKVDGIREKIDNNKFLFEARPIHVTVTIGISEYKDDLSIDEWINIADDKLYQGKKSGKNQIVK